MRGIVVIALSAALLGSRFAPSLSAQPRKGDDCTTDLAMFVREIDGLLARRPRNLDDVSAVLWRYFPVRLQGCGAEVALPAIGKSAFFSSTERHGSRTNFGLYNGTRA
jgi:hypothetical protein